ncbi:Tex family protein [Bacillus sp. FSL K6-3431]|uniref:Tex family protein n=1 Tax=Bacillus sp. FSL K6-3431 TaxID=2921500 RepID=UPI0030F608FA
MIQIEQQDDLLIKQLSDELKLAKKQVQSVIELLEEGNTVPFIARYRKEMTGALDEVQIKSILDNWQYLQNLEQRKIDVIRLIEEQGKLTEELQQEIVKAKKLQIVEDLYRPYKQKRRTKATVAKEKGLEPLAEWLLSLSDESSVESEAKRYVSAEKEVLSAEDAIKGAQDIIAEQISDDPNIRQWVRKETFQSGKIASLVKDAEKDDKSIFEMYYEYEEPIKKIVPHRILALNRGEKEDILRVSLKLDNRKVLQYINKYFIKKEHANAAPIVVEAIEDGYKRLIEPAIERELRNELTEKAENQAIHIFSENLRNLLLQPPLKGKVVLGLDPAYRTGCKLAVVDETGKVLEIDVIFPHPPKAKQAEAKDKMMNIIRKYHVEIIAIGNGTASQESEQFTVDVLKELQTDLAYLIVNEAGASVYSASDLAREEFPHLQVEERSAVSIARRLQDPLAELVKIDPKSVGVGQYQHDVTQKKLNDSLSFVVETAVNQVGVNVNTASSSLLQYVSGLSKTVANNIVKQREETGKFANRKQLKKIPRLGAKTYEQAIGFMRIFDGEEPLDLTPIHPESYGEVQRLLTKLGFSTSDLGTEALIEALRGINVDELAAELDLGVLTLTDIIDALMKPGRDLRDEQPKPLLKKDLLKLNDLLPGMELQGTVRNVVDFGAFVDVGVKEDGLVHISKLSNRFVKHPLDVVSLGDVVTVWVEKVDVQKGRLSLTMLKTTN